MRKHLYIFILSLALLSLMAAAHASDSIFAGYSHFDFGNHLLLNGGAADLPNLDSGWFRNDGKHFAGNQNYETGYCEGCGGDFYYHSYFSFNQLPTAFEYTSATFTVNSYTIKDYAGTLLLYGTDLDPYDVNSSHDWDDVGKYNALVSGSLLGSISLTPDDSDRYVTVDFTPDGIDWLKAHVGAAVVIGADWAPVPEPSTLVLIGSGALGLASVVRRKLW